MDYKELLKEIQQKCSGVLITEEKHFKNDKLGEVILSYDGTILFNRTFMWGNEQDRDEAYQDLFYELVDSGIRRMAEIAGFLSLGG
jgi:hypothetical protein